MNTAVFPLISQTDASRPEPERGFGGISFLHTAPGHVATFGAVMTALAPEIPVRHEVADPILAQARHRGALTTDLAERAHRAFDDLAERGAKVVVCTCSTLGPCADERTPQAGDGGLVVLRADRAAILQAYQAAQAGNGRVYVAACLDSTLPPTLDLFSALEAEHRAGVVAIPLAIPEPWVLFHAGLRKDFRHAIAGAITAHLPQGGVVLLNQPSMAGAAALLPDDRFQVISSPLPGVQAAIDAWRQA